MKYQYKKAIKIALSVLLLLITTAVKAQFVSLNKTEMQKVVNIIKTHPGAQKVYLSLVHRADSALDQSPNPVDTIISEGHLATDPKKIHTQVCLADMDKIYALAYVYKVSGKRVYLQKCAEYIKAWATINQAVGNPINNTKLEPLFEAYDLIKDELPANSQATVNAWLIKIADVEINNLRSAGKKTGYNNWNSHRIKVVGYIAYILNNKNYQLYTDTSLKKQVLKNLYANGSGIDFEERDALHYHIYTLEPLLRIAAVIKRATGFNYYSYVSPSGSSIQKSVEFLIPYVTGEKTHEEYVNTKAAFDKKRANNNEPAFKIGANFNPETAVDVVSYAAYFNPPYFAIIKKLLHTQNNYPNWQAVLNAAKRMKL